MATPVYQIVMQTPAIEKAKDRLSSARARLSDLAAAKTYDAARRNWYEFLLCSNAIFSVLEQGGKSSPKSKAWLDAKKQERKRDPLLRYLHHARNADEHNVPSVTALDRQKIVMVENGRPVAEIRDVIGNEGRFFSLTDDTSPNLTSINEMRIYPDRAKLIPVYDRGVIYTPPTEHLGSVLQDNGPIIVARLMVQYLDALVVEAQALT